METLKKLGIGALVLGLSWVAWTRARTSLATPEQRIRWRLEEMAEGFHDNVLRRVVRGFHPDYRDSAGADRDDVQGALVYLFFQDRDPETGRFAYRLELPEPELAIRIDPEDGRRATVTLRAVFHRARRGQEEVWWDTRATLDFVKEDGEWRILQSRDVSHRDRRR